MIKETVTVTEVIDYLNEITELDRSAILAIFTNRVKCNEKLANHPTVQIGESNGDFTVGILGILNGLFGVDENNWGPICSVSDKSNKARPYRFDRTPGPEGKIVDPDLYGGKYEKRP